MWFIGDVHGHKNAYFHLIKTLKMDESIQVGDLGFGFPGRKWPEKWDTNHKFFPGNHDNRQECLKHPNCLGNYGYLPDKEIYFISGAWSIDFQHRIVGIDMWDDEELSYAQFDEVRKDIELYQPKTIVTHDCPSQIRGEMFGFDRFYPTKTGSFLNTVLEVAPPKYWIFGHYHRAKQTRIGKTHFICLQELECCEIK